MIEPTIDEMLDWLDQWEGDNGRVAAIRAILEQHREVEALCNRNVQLEAIRAFVERVEGRLPDYDTGRGADAMLKAYRQAVYDELAAIEKETE